jgi:hypothetical protein
MDKRFKKVVIWGHPLNSHTHSYIHAGFYKAFSFLGYETHWLNNSSNLSGINFKETLFITEGQVDSNIPLIKDSFYVLHNLNPDRYLNCGCKVLTLQVHTKEVPSRGESFNLYTTIENSSPVRCLYQPWATDLLPQEINLDSARNNLTDPFCFWAGTNQGNISPFLEVCSRNGVRSVNIDPWGNPISFDENRKMVNESYISPAIQSDWQIDHGYIPCRIFKNISYGHFGYTNSESVNSIFGDSLVYSKNTTDLFHKIIEKKNDPNHIKELKELMMEVKNNHTYINRIKTILSFLPS